MTQHAVSSMSLAHTPHPNLPASAPHIPAQLFTCLLPVVLTVNFSESLECPTFFITSETVCVLPSVQKVFVFPLCLRDYESPFKIKLKYQFLWKISIVQVKCTSSVPP